MVKTAREWADTIILNVLPYEYVTADQRDSLVEVVEQIQKDSVPSSGPDKMEAEESGCISGNCACRHL